MSTLWQGYTLETKSEKGISNAETEPPLNKQGKEQKYLEALKLVKVQLYAKVPLRS